MNRQSALGDEVVIGYKPLVTVAGGVRCSMTWRCRPHIVADKQYCTRANRQQPRRGCRSAQVARQCAWQAAPNQCDSKLSWTRIQ